jgi:hypothetical protein
MKIVENDLELFLNYKSFKDCYYFMIEINFYL